MTVWSSPGPEVDVVMDLRNLTFRAGSVDELFVFHVCESLFEEDVVRAIVNWHKLLSPGGKLHVINDDFEYVARGFIGGDFSIDLFNRQHNHPFQCTQDGVVRLLRLGGFNPDKINMWLNGAPEGVNKAHYEFILTAIKNAE